MTGHCIAVLTIATGLLLSQIGTASAVDAAGPPTCGGVVAGTVSLDRDLNCTGDGLVIAKSGATINLNGHTLAGNGSGVGVQTEGGTPVIVRGGTIRGFMDGLEASMDSGPVTVEDVSFVENSRFGITSRAGVLRVSRSSFTGNQTGLEAPGHSTTTSVEASSFTRNRSMGLTATWGKISISGSVLTHNPTGIYIYHANSTISGNIIHGGDTGVYVGWRGDEVRFTHNVVTQAGVGLKLMSPSGGSVADNVFSFNGSAGMRIEKIFVMPGGTVHVERNLYVGNGFWPRGQVVQNQPADSGLVASMGVLKDNIAYGNAGHGIHAFGAQNGPFPDPMPPPVDAGGNTARGNSREPQCVLIQCG